MQAVSLNGFLQWITAAANENTEQYCTLRVANEVQFWIFNFQLARKSAVRAININNLHKKIKRNRNFLVLGPPVFIFEISSKT